MCKKVLVAAVLWGALVLVSCPLNIPEKATIKASPSVYMPIGSPKALKDLAGAGSLNSLANVEISSGYPSYDYRGPEYGDTRVLMVVMKDLVNQNLSSSISIPPSLPPGGFSVSGLTIPTGTGNNIDLSSLLGSGGVLKDYPGLEFRSVPAYLYISGPATVLAASKINLKFQGGGITFPGFTNEPVKSMVLPDLPPAPGPITATLAASEMDLDLKGIFNASPPPASLKAELDFTVGNITIYSLDELRAFAAELQTPLTAHLVLLLPFRFTAKNPIPVFAGPDPANPPGSSPKPAVKLIDKGGDLLGREPGGDDIMDDIGRNLKALSLEVSVVNNLGINGFIKMLPAMPGAYNPAAEGLGKIGLSGVSSIIIPGETLKNVPFSPALEVYLEGDFDIKRKQPSLDAMTMNLGIILHTDLEKTF
jgi:hypothetical protein